MLQDSMRSAVYRSLTKPLADGCEDASQTDACRTQMQSKTSYSCQPKNPQHTLVKGRRELKEGTNTMRRREKSEAQLSRVSRGAHKLTQMIDSLSKSPNLNGQSKHFARDLLRGSLDLEESLAMLSKTQEGSRKFGLQEPRFSVDGYSSMPHFKYRKRSEFVGEECDASERMSIRRFGYQEPRHSIDGSFRSSVEQMQRMPSMFNSKQRLNLLKEETGVEQKSRYSFDESSRPVELKGMSQVKFKQSSRLTEEEIRVQEMIGYKRFGLHESGFSVGGSSRDSIEELRRVIRDSLFQQNLLPRSPEDERTCRSNRYERFNDTSSVSATPQPKKTKGPNLIAKLMGLEEAPPQTVEPVKDEVKKKSSNVPRPAIDIDRPKAKKLQLLEKKKKKASTKKKPLQEIIEAMQFKGLLKGTQAHDVSKIKPHPFDEMQLEKYSSNFNMDDESPPIVIMKPLYLPQWERAEVQKNLLVDKFSGNEEIKSNPIREENVSDQERTLSKSLDREEVKCIEKAKMDTFAISQKQQRNEAFQKRKKADERQKPQLAAKIEEEKKHGKAKRMPISQTNTTSSAPAKSDKRQSRTMNKVFLVNPESKNSANPVKEKKTPRVKSDGKSTDIKSNERNQTDGKETIVVHEMDTLPKRTTLPADKIPQEMEKEAKTCNKDNPRENQQPSVVVMPKASQARNGPEITKEVIHLPDKKPATTKAAVVEDDLMCLLLSSRSSLTRTQELYGIDAHQRIHRPIKGIEEDVMRNAKLYLDCGKEIMERKSHQHELFLYPTLQTQMCYRTASFTSHQLAEEISSKIRILASYIKVDRNNITSDVILYLRLERDIRCKDMLVNAMWDIGWITWGYPEEAGEVACEMEESILSSLISEVAIELVC